MPSPKSAGIKADLVLVEWLDAHSVGDSTWVELPEATADHVPYMCHSVGWALKKDKTGITLFASFCEDGDIGEVSFIPIGMINNVTVLKKAR